jgi:hypothetical protein
LSGKEQCLEGRLLWEDFYQNHDTLYEEVASTS